MAPTNVLQAGERLLGTYFVVQGLQALVATTQVFAVVLPDGSSRGAYIAATAASALVFVVAGMYLLRASRETSADRDIAFEAAAFESSGVQLLGVYFLIEGSWAVARSAFAILFYSALWPVRTSDALAGVVAVLAGVILMTRSTRIAAWLMSMRNRSGREVDSGHQQTLAIGDQPPHAVVDAASHQQTGVVPTNSHRRYRIGIWMLGISSSVAAIALAVFFVEGIRESFSYLLLATVPPALIAGVVLVTSSISRVSTRQVLYWSAPGLTALVALGLMKMQDYMLVVTSVPVWIVMGGLWVAGGVIAPVTSVGATVLVGRSRNSWRLAACVGSWMGAILFWSSGSLMARSAASFRP